MRILDRATGTNTYLGLYHEDEDIASLYPSSRYDPVHTSWRFDTTDAFVLHIPSAAHVPMAAFDLEGHPVQFPAWGALWREMADGTVIVLEGHAPPKLTAARLSCPLTIPSAAGVVVREGPEYAYISDWWHYPEFPSRSGAVLIADDIGQPRIRGSLVYYQQEGQLQVHDLQTRTSSLIQGDLAEFALSDTHVLWREATGVDIAPMHLLELTTGVDIELGDFDAAIDNPSMGDRPELGWSWNFDLAGKYVLHVPEDPGAPREAFDLHGTRLPLPLPGSVLLMLASGHLLAEDEATPGIFATRPGDANTTRLDYPRSPDTPMTLAVVEDRLEAVFGDALHEVPLDGGPARLLVDDVGADRHWLDERHLATIFAGKLTVIDTTTGAREIHGEHATLSALAPDAEGLYFNVAAAPGDPNNGLWYLPRTALAP